MREIKFRAWDDNNKYFCSRSWVEGHWYFALYSKDIVLQQYTGLKDSKGVEIYEGDIVTDAEVNAPVIYFKEECQFVADFGVGIEYQILGEWCEVIGNIYENPELLK